MAATENKGPSMSKYARFSSLVLQMGLIIGFFVWLGTYMDKLQKMETPWWTIGLSLFGVFAALYLIIREVIKSSNEE
jgi:ATP synthase protein I